jgi:hypothetical protein
MFSFAQPRNDDNRIGKTDILARKQLLASSVIWRTNGLDRGIIDKNGNMGIGTMAPESLLHLQNGNVQIDAPSTTAENQNNLYENGILLQGEGGNYRITKQYNTAGFSTLSLYNVDNPDASIYLLQNGYIGFGGTFYAQNNNKYAFHDQLFAPTVRTDQLLIGQIEETVAMDYAVKIDGKIICEDLTVLNSEKWPDYVFEQDYSLLSIEDLHQFLTDNHHLPNLPNAKEVEENGVSQAEMNKLLLEKVEELTLYIIQLHEEQQKLEQKLNK